MTATENKTDFEINDIIGIAERENNLKRKHVIVNRYQAKHVPASPTVTLNLSKQLGGIVCKDLQGNLKDKKVTFIAFAETATAIGANIARTFPHDCYFIHTTRETLDNRCLVVDFKEEHSHAVEQLLYCKDAEAVLKNADEIVFIDDEITTGNTILNFVNALLGTGLDKHFSVASIINGMSKYDISEFEKRDINIYYLIKRDSVWDDTTFESAAAPIIKPTASVASDIIATPLFTDSINSKKSGIAEGLLPPLVLNVKANRYRTIEIGGYINPRLGLIFSHYNLACDRLSDEVFNTLEFGENEKIVVLGTEEFMYPAICCGEKIENRRADCSVRVHATTRSPIIVKSSKNYPLNSRIKMNSVYEEGRITYIYNLAEYDKAIIVAEHDKLRGCGLSELICALQSCNIKDIIVVKWKK